MQEDLTERATKQLQAIAAFEVQSQLVVAPRGGRINISGYIIYNIIYIYIIYNYNIIYIYIYIISYHIYLSVYIYIYYIYNSIWNVYVYLLSNSLLYIDTCI